MAERGGFEPPIGFNTYGGLAIHEATSEVEISEVRRCTEHHENARISFYPCNYRATESAHGQGMSLRFSVFVADDPIHAPASI